MDPLRVTVVGPGPNLPGGMSTYVRGLIGYLRQEADLSVEYLDETAVKGHSAQDCPGSLRILAGSIRMVRAFRRHLADRRPQVIHLHSAHGRSLTEKAALATIARRAGIPAIIHMHGSEIAADLASTNAFRMRFLAGSVAPPNRLVVLSAVAARLFRSHMPNTVATIVHVTVQVPEGPIEFPQGDPIIGFLGALEGRKGEEVLLRALAECGEPRVRLEIAGSGPNRERAERLATELGLQERVTFLGAVDAEQRGRFLGRISALCLPSFAEGMPASLMEAMAVGRPVIATPVGAVTEFVTDPDVGWLVPTGDVGALAAALREMAAPGADLRGRGLRGFALVKSTFDWPVAVRQIKTVYQELAGQP